MKSLHTPLNNSFSINMLRDEFPVVFATPGKPRSFKKHFLAARALVKGAPLAADPAKILKKERDSRGLV